MLVLLLLAGCAGPQRFEQSRVLMGTRARVVLYANDRAEARRAADAALDRIARLEAVMSDYREDSELMRLCAVGGGTVSNDLRDVLRAAQRVSEESDGAFDVTVGPLVALWRGALATGALPAPVDLEAARGP